MDNIFMKFDNMPVSKINDKTESFPKMFGIESKENYISNWLAYILDPSRFLSNEPLIKFLELIKENDEDDLAILRNHLSSTGDFDTANLNVQREVTLSASGRIDLLIEYDIEDTFIAIGIENKIYSPLMSGQVNRYKNALIRMYKEDHQKYRVIALTPSWNSSQKNEIDYHYSYDELAKAFESIAFNKLDYRQYFIIREFIKYIEDFLIEESSMLDYDWAEYNRKNADKLAEVYDSGKKQLQNLCELITNYLIEEFNANSEESDWKVSSHHKTYFYIQLYKEGWTQYNIHFEIGKTDEFHTKNFILPSELLLTIDIENDESKRILRSKKDSTDIKIIGEYNQSKGKGGRDYIKINSSSKNPYKMSYSSLETIKATLAEMVKEIKRVDQESIEKVISYIVSEKSTY